MTQLTGPGAHSFGAQASFLASSSTLARSAGRLTIGECPEPMSAKETCLAIASSGGERHDAVDRLEDVGVDGAVRGWQAADEDHAR
jgi:hypothetical protein